MHLCKDDIKDLANLLKTSSTLEGLYLDHNDLDAKDVRLLAKALLQNGKLKDLWFDDNMLPQRKMGRFDSPPKSQQQPLTVIANLFPTSSPTITSLRTPRGSPIARSASP